MRIDQKLNLVLPIERDDGPPALYVHAAPIGREVFERYYMLLAKVFNKIWAQEDGFMHSGGPRLAALILRDAARASNVSKDRPDGDWPDVERGLMAEIRRLANVVQPGANGWETVPLQEAITRQTFSTDELSEVENAIVFFIAVSAMQKRSALKVTLSVMAILWDAVCTSSNVTAFRDGLPTSTAAGSSGETAAAS